MAEVIAAYASYYDLAKAAPAAIEAARIAFIDTIGVMLAGSGEEVGHIAFDMVMQEGGARKSTIVGRGLPTSPQLAALANGMAAHGMDFDLTYMSGQSTAGIIRTLLALGEVAALQAQWWRDGGWVQLQQAGGISGQGDRRHPWGSAGVPA